MSGPANPPTPETARQRADPELSVVVPIFNEFQSIDKLVDELVRSLVELGRPFEIILVDDGSTDGTTERCRDLAANNPSVKLIGFRRNFGQTAALMAGFYFSSGDLIIAIDGDGQNDPSDIAELLAKLDQGYDVVSGWRKSRKDGLVRSFLSRVANVLVSWISGVKLRDYGCTLKIYRRSVLQDVRLYGEMHRYIPIYTAWQGAKVTEIPVNHRPRMFGRSKYGLGRTWKVVLDLILIAFLERAASRPMHLFGGVGLLSLMAALAAGLLAIWLKVIEGTSFISTPLPLLVVMLTVLGIISIFSGLLAEMIVRTYYESQDKKPYSVKFTVKFPADR